MSTKGLRKSLKSGWKRVFGGRAQPTAEVQPPKQGKHSTEASFSNATEPHARPDPSVAKTQATRATTEGGAKEVGLYVTASLQKIPKSSSCQTQAQPVESQAEDPPATETTEQSPALSLSQELWNAAYDSLAKGGDNAENKGTADGKDTAESKDTGVDKDTAKLVKCYVKTLATVLSAEASSDADSVAAELEDKSKRQTHMRRLVKEGQAKISTLSKITTGVGDVAQFILSAKGMIDAAVGNIPQAALPWAGVCVGLQILSNPGRAIQSNLAGIAHVVFRMDWYCTLSEHFLKKDRVDDFLGSILPQLKARIIALYKALLLYQMKSVCSYYRRQSLIFLRSLANWDDWDADLKAVTDAEETLLNDWDKYDKLKAESLRSKLVELAEGMEGLLKDIRQDIREFIALQRGMQRDDEDAECLRDLFVVDPQDDMEKIEKKKDELVDGAYKWILDRDEYAAFTNWSNDASGRLSCPLMWVKGLPGTGKTMLLIGIIRELSTQPAKLAPNVSHFFCQGTDTALNSATATLRSLVWLLLVQQPHLVSHLRLKHKNAGSSLFEGETAFIALSNAFKSMLKDPNLRPVYFIIDALDECEQGLADLIKLISASLTLTDKVKWLVSSRPSVELKIPDTAGSWVELDAQRLEDPVKAYINHKLSILETREGYDDRVLAEVAVEVRQRAKNTFLWVALALKELDREDKNHNLVHGMYAPSIIRKMPSGLSELYDHMMIRIEEGMEKDPQYCKTVLVSTVLAYRPLTLSELAVLADLPLGMHPRTIVKKCGSFLTTKDEAVYLIHQSAKDYLDKNYTSKLQLAGVAQGHADIGRRSIKAMSSVLRQNIYNLHFGFRPMDITPPEPDPLAKIRYSCVFWADHLCFENGESPACKQELTDDGRVFEFLKERFLYWLESLSLLGNLSDGVQSIRRLLHIAQSQPDKSPQFAGFLKDAEKFVLRHGSIIERAPLQTYGSALVFSPTMSAIRSEQWKERLPFIRNVYGIRDSWTAHQQTLEGHSGWVWSVAFSPDGRTLASASDDRTVRLWDTATGAYQRTLEGHSGWVRSVAFSPDGKTLASASDDKTVQLWDTATGTHQRTLEGHSGSVWSVAFSPDGKTLASASDDETVGLWDTATGAHQRTLEGHSGSVWSVAFSPDGRTLASASDDRTVRLWDTATGAYQRTLEGHSDWVRSVAFSPDGKTLASGSDDKTVQLWDTATGAYQRTLEGHSDWVRSVAFSPDGRTLASASGDETVRLWDTATGTHQRTLEGHSGSVWSVAFSPDGRTLASASGDETVRLWDTATGTHQRTLEGHSGSVWSVAFSPDGRTLASASDDRTVRLWDTATGAYQRTLEGHSDWVRSVAFSPDGRTLASASDDETVGLWDTATGAYQRTLEGHSGWVRSVAFSLDGRTLASASDDKTVRLWDTATGAHQRTLDVDVTIGQLSFSADGSCLHTDRGVLDITYETASPYPASTTPALFVREQWIVCGSETLLWLPPDYRATSVAVFRDTVALGHASGGVSIMELTEPPPHPPPIQV